MTAITDIHSHLLPGIDDGSRSCTESLRALIASSAEGVSRQFLTPHYRSDISVQDFLVKRDKALERMLDAASAGYTNEPEEGELPGSIILTPAAEQGAEASFSVSLSEESKRTISVFTGAEVAYHTALRHIDGLPELCLGGSSILLLEMPMCQWTTAMFDDIGFIIGSLGLTPAIAHMERYHGVTSESSIRTLADMPVLVQMNAAYIISRRTRALAMLQLSRGRVDLLGSDAHGMRRRRPNLGSAVSLLTAPRLKRRADEIFERAAKIR